MCCSRSSYLLSFALHLPSIHLCSRSEDQFAKEVTAVFADWSIEFLDRVFSFLLQRDKPEKRPGYTQRIGNELFRVRPRLKQKEEGKMLIAISLCFFQRAFFSFFSQMSPTLHAVALTKTQTFLRENIVPNAQKLVPLLPLFETSCSLFFFFLRCATQREDSLRYSGRKRRESVSSSLRLRL